MMGKLGGKVCMICSFLIILNCTANGQSAAPRVEYTAEIPVPINTTTIILTEEKITLSIQNNISIEMKYKFKNIQNISTIDEIRFPVHELSNITIFMNKTLFPYYFNSINDTKLIYKRKYMKYIYLKMQFKPFEEKEISVYSDYVPIWFKEESEVYYNFYYFQAERKVNILTLDFIIDNDIYYIKEKHYKLDYSDWIIEKEGNLIYGHNDYSNVSSQVYNLAVVWYGERSNVEDPIYMEDLLKYCIPVVLLVIIIFTIIRFRKK